MNRRIEMTRCVFEGILMTPMSSDDDGAPDAGPWLDLKQLPPFAIASQVVAAVGVILVALAVATSIGFTPVPPALAGVIALGVSAVALVWVGFTAFVISRESAHTALRLEGFIEEVSQAFERVDSDIADLDAGHAASNREASGREIPVRVLSRPLERAK